MIHEPKESREWACTDDAPVNTGFYNQDYDSIPRVRYVRDLSEPDDTEDPFFANEIGGEG